MTRRELALSLAATAPALLTQQMLAQQTAPSVPTPEESLQSTRDQLRKFKVPIDTEPSFAFHP